MLFGGGDSDGGGDGGAEAHVDYGVDGGGHGTASAGADGASFSFPFFSPLAIATLLGTTGACGLIAAKGLGLAGIKSLVADLPAALVLTYIVTYASWRLVTRSRGSSQIRLDDLKGALAEVITPIPAGGIGEVAAMVSGQRYTAPAREESGKAVARGGRVTVKAMLGTTLIVTQGDGTHASP